MGDEALRTTLRQLPPDARDSLRRLLTANQADRDAAAERLLREQTQHTSNLADLIDMLSLDADTRRRAARLLGELEARGD